MALQATTGLLAVGQVLNVLRTGMTPFVTAMLIGDMLVAIFEVHASKGLWSQNGGFEYNLVLIAMLFCLGLIGPGMYSLDGRLPALLVISLIVVGVAVVPGHILTG